jgi:leucyl-tRNA synthetase
VDLRPVDRAIAEIGADLEEMRFNTAIASLMEFVRWARRERDQMSSEEWARVSVVVVLLVAPLAPHLAEELWSRIGGEYSVHQQRWPAFDASALVVEHVTLVIQVDGKTRDRIQVPAGLNRQESLERAKRRENVRRHLLDAEPRKVIFVPDRLINLVTNQATVSSSLDTSPDADPPGAVDGDAGANPAESAVP